MRIGQILPPLRPRLERQIRWEAASIEAGIKLCREEPANPALTLADTSPGQRIIRENSCSISPCFS